MEDRDRRVLRWTGLPKEEVEGAAGLTKEGVSELTATRTPSSSSSLSETAVSSTGPLISISDQYSLNPDPSGNRNPVLDTSCFLTMPGSGINPLVPNVGYLTCRVAPQKRPYLWSPWSETNFVNGASSCLDRAMTVYSMTPICTVFR